MGQRFFPPPAQHRRMSAGRPRIGEAAYERLRQAEKRGRSRAQELAAAADESPGRRVSTLSPTRSGATQRAATTKAVEAKPFLSIITLNRLAHGPRSGDVGYFESLGSNGTERLTNWVDEQLDPASIDDSEMNTKLNQAGYDTLDKTFDEVWQQHVVADPDWEYYIRPFFETLLSTYLRATWSKRQLFEVMVRFWHDHFNVYGEEAGPMFMLYDREVIRPNALGNFQDMLEGVARHPVMLEYLDNKYNSFDPGLPNDGINENYARELLELHTLGAEHYLSNADPADVPMQNGWNIGYTDTDVTMAARCLTGWTVSDQWWDPAVGNTGHFKYMHSWHDTATDKSMLGVPIAGKDTPQHEGLVLLNRLARHRGTAVFVSRKMCRRLVADDPAESLVQSTADVFMANLDASDQIAQMVRHIALSSEFKNTWAEKVKRPFEIVLSAFRATNAQFTWARDDTHLGLLWWLGLIGNRPFHWAPPDGFPDVREAWISSSPRVMTWRICNWFPVAYINDWWGPSYLDIVGQTPSGATATTAVDHWINALFRRNLSATERQLYIDFMANGGNPNAVLDLSDDRPWDDPDRLRTLVGLMLMSPTFLWR